MKKATKLILAAILTLAFGFVWFYFTLPAVNLRAASFWITLVLLGAVFFFAYKIFGGRSAFESFAHNAKEKNGQKKPMGKRAKQILIVAIILAVVITLIALIAVYWDVIVAFLMELLSTIIVIALVIMGLRSLFRSR